MRGSSGLDTSHVVAFTQALNANPPKPGLAGVRVVAAYPKGSPDIEASVKHGGAAVTLREVMDAARAEAAK